MVLSFLSLTTTPSRMRFGIFVLLLRHGALRLDRLQTGDVAADLADACGILDLARGFLEAQVELLLLQLQDFVLHLVLGHGPDVCDLHWVMSPYSPSRATKRVLIGSLAAARPRDSSATVRGTPSISTITRPGFTLAAQYSVEPLPEPMRTSAGFFDTGTSGNTRIQTRPARFMPRVSARRAASIWRAVSRSGSCAFSPTAPKSRLAQLVALPWVPPLWALRKF